MQNFRGIYAFRLWLRFFCPFLVCFIKLKKYLWSASIGKLQYILSADCFTNGMSSPLKNGCWNRRLRLQTHATYSSTDFHKNISPTLSALMPLSYAFYLFDGLCLKKLVLEVSLSLPSPKNTDHASTSIMEYHLEWRRMVLWKNSFDLRCTSLPCPQTSRQKCSHRPQFKPFL